MFSGTDDVALRVRRDRNVDSTLSMSIRTRPGLRDIRARSVTLVVWVTEKSIVWRSSKRSREVRAEF
jgi:hypothetical protein